MLYFDRIVISQGTDINKTSASKECDTCYYWYFLDKGFNFQQYVRNGCHETLMMYRNLNHIAILHINGANYRCIIDGINKSNAFNLLKNADLTEKKEYYKNKKV